MSFAAGCGAHLSQVLLHKLRAHHADEGCCCVVRYRLGQHSFACRDRITSITSHRCSHKLQSSQTACVLTLRAAWTTCARNLIAHTSTNTFTFSNTDVGSGPSVNSSQGNHLHDSREATAPSRHCEGLRHGHLPELWQMTYPSCAQWQPGHMQETSEQEEPLPVPGGPHRSTPRGGSMPICLYSSCCVRGSSTASLISCFWMSLPPMSCTTVCIPVRMSTESHMCLRNQQSEASLKRSKQRKCYTEAVQECLSSCTWLPAFTYGMNVLHNSS